MRRQRKVNSLRRHYNESTTSLHRANTGSRVRWVFGEPRVASPLSNPSRRSINTKQKVAGSVRNAPSQSAKNQPTTQARKDSLGFDPARSLSGIPTGLCTQCYNITLWHFQTDHARLLHHRNFVELVKSASTCVLCFIFAKQAPIPPPTANYAYDGTKQIVLSATSRRTELEGTPGLALDNLVVHLPVIRKDNRRSFALPAQAHLMAGRDSQAGKTQDVVRRRTHGGTNLSCAIDWLAECVTNHRECRKSTDLIGTLMYAVPPRLLDLGPSENSPISLIETDHNFASPYVALTYTRGESKVFSTNRANLSSRRELIAMDKFNKTFKQAISVTRDLGFRYLWIDTFCIVMDSSEDRTKHVPRMGIIFHNAALTLSAAVSSSADEGLIRYKARSLPEARIPYRNKDGLPLGHFFVTNHKPHDFAEDVVQGDLNSRAWCLQARALSRRTLHFGNDQLFWECDAGVWSEGSSLRCPAESLNDPMVEWRMSMLRYKRAREIEPQQITSFHKQTRPTSAELAIPKIYHLWYHLVAQYTTRVMPREKDKSSAIAGLAYVFACLISQRQTRTGPIKPRADTYVCGLWQNDLPFGLLWSPGSFHRWRNKYAKYPSAPRAPSWSWLSVDGPLQWPDGVVFSSGSFTGRSFVKLLEVGSHYDRRTNHDFSTLRVRGKVALLSKLYGFRPEDVEWKRTARDHDVQKHADRADDVEGPINIPCAMFDSAEVARVWTMLHGATVDRPSTGSSSADQTTSTRTQGMFSRSIHRSSTAGRPSASAQPKLMHDQQKDFVALLVIPAGCAQSGCQEHNFESSRLSATLPLNSDTAFRAQNNCGQGLAYALILYPSSMGEGLFRRVGIAQVRTADFATVERRRDREVVIV